MTASILAALADSESFDPSVIRGTSSGKTVKSLLSAALVSSPLNSYFFVHVLSSVLRSTSILFSTPAAKADTASMEASSV